MAGLSHLFSGGGSSTLDDLEWSRSHFWHLFCFWLGQWRWPDPYLVIQQASQTCSCDSHRDSRLARRQLSLFKPLPSLFQAQVQSKSCGPLTWCEKWFHVRMVWEVIPCLEKRDSMCDQFCYLYNFKNRSDKGTVTINLNNLWGTGRFNMVKVTEPMNGRSAMRQSDSVVWFLSCLLASWGRHNKIGTDLKKHCVSL